MKILGKKLSPKIVTIIALLLFSSFLLLGANDEETESGIREAMIGAETTMRHLNNFPTETGRAQDLSAEEKDVYTLAYEQELAKYYASESNQRSLYSAYYRDALNRELDEIYYKADGGVCDCKIIDLNVSKSQGTATATADLVVWSRYIVGTEGNIYINNNIGKIRMTAELVMEDGTWKVLSVPGYEIDVDEETMSEDTWAAIEKTESAQIRHATYSTFIEALEASKNIDMNELNPYSYE